MAQSIDRRQPIVLRGQRAGQRLGCRRSRGTRSGDRVRLHGGRGERDSWRQFTAIGAEPAGLYRRPGFVAELVQQLSHPRLSAPVELPLTESFGGRLRCHAPRVVEPRPESGLRRACRRRRVAQGRRDGLIHGGCARRQMSGPRPSGAAAHGSFALKASRLERYLVCLVAAQRRAAGSSRSAVGLERSPGSSGEADRLRPVDVLRAE